MNIHERFWAKVDKSTKNGCWEWTACTTQKGYGTFYALNADGKETNIRAHRFSYELVYGKIPDGLMVCHKCDNPKCVNPNHLFLGTGKENMEDAKRKGRHYTPEVKKRWSLAKLGKPSRLKGRHLSDEQRAKMSTIRQGKIMIKDDIVNDVIEKYISGYSALALSMEFKIDRSTIKRILKNKGIAIRNIKEAKLSSPNPNNRRRDLKGRFT